MTEADLRKFGAPPARRLSPHEEDLLSELSISREAFEALNDAGVNELADVHQLSREGLERLLADPRWVAAVKLFATDVRASSQKQNERRK